MLKCYPARVIRKGENNMRNKLAMGGLILGAIWGAYRRLRRPILLQGSYARAPTKILIIGGGFGGLSVARELARALRGTENVGVALVDRLNYTTYFGTPGAEEHAMDVKGLGDALRVRNHVIDCFEKAEHLDDRAPDDLLTFVVVGGGPTGVEAVADMHDLIFDVLEGDYPNVDFGRVRVVLVNAGDQILRGLDSSLVNAATRRLASQRIEVINEAKVEEVGSDAVEIADGRTIPTQTTLWA